MSTSVPYLTVDHINKLVYFDILFNFITYFNGEKHFLGNLQRKKRQIYCYKHVKFSEISPMSLFHFSLSDGFHWINAFQFQNFASLFKIVTYLIYLMRHPPATITGQVPTSSPTPHLHHTRPDLEERVGRVIWA